MDKSRIRLAIVLVSQVLLVLPLATIVRETNDSGSILTVAWTNGFVFGLPWLIATAVAVRLALPESRSRRGWNGLSWIGAWGTLSVFFSFVALIAFDEWLAGRYLKEIRKSLSEDTRFQDVRVLGLSRNYLLFPYHPVAGTVETEDDKRTLQGLLETKWSPGYVSARVVLVRRKDIDSAEKAEGA